MEYFGRDENEVGQVIGAFQKIRTEMHLNPIKEIMPIYRVVFVSNVLFHEVNKI
jgi:hypothetical protein